MLFKIAKGTFKAPNLILQLGPGILSLNNDLFVNINTNTTVTYNGKMGKIVNKQMIGCDRMH